MIGFEGAALAAPFVNARRETVLVTSELRDVEKLREWASNAFLERVQATRIVIVELVAIIQGLAFAQVDGKEVLKKLRSD
jgi:hypothetical protein